MFKSIIFFLTCIAISHLGMFSSMSYAGLVKDLYSKNENVSQNINYYLTGMTTNNISVVENSVISIPIDINQANIADYSVLASSNVVEISLQKQLLVLNVGEVEEDISVSLTLMNENQPIDESYDITLTIINVSTWAISNYANVKIEDLLLSEQDLDIRNYGLVLPSGGFGLYRQDLATQISQSALVKHGRLSTGELSSINKGGSYFGGSGQSIQLVNDLTGSSASNQPQSNGGSSVFAHLSSQTLSPIAKNLYQVPDLSPKYKIDYQPSSSLKQAGATTVARYESPYKEVLKKQIAQAVASRSEALNYEETPSVPNAPIENSPKVNSPSDPEPSNPVDNSPLVNSSETQEPFNNQPVVEPLVVNEPSLAPIKTPDLTQEPELFLKPNALIKQADSPVIEKQVVQVPEPSTIYLFGIFLLGLFFFNRHQNTQVSLA